MRKHLLNAFLFIHSLLVPTTLLLAQGTNELSAAEYTKIKDVLPPSPNSASLGRYGGMEVGMATGTIQHAIDLYTLTSHHLQLPISLSYSSNGLRVDEIASRAGTGWNFIAGGIITRTVYGRADERSTRVVPPADFPARSWDLLTFLELLATEDGMGADGQPDLFSFNFNGYSGKFILDSNSEPVLLTHSALKITKSFSTTESSFLITTPDGVQYLFGGEEATEYSTKGVEGTACGKSFPARTPTAWYLKKIIHPNSDDITFSYNKIGFGYSTSISQSVYSLPEVVSTCIDGMALDGIPASECKSVIETESPLLHTITTANGGKVTFDYVDRLDGQEKLLSAVKVFRVGTDKVFKVFDILYQDVNASKFSNYYQPVSGENLRYRPFLMSITERTPDYKLTKKHSFDYYDLHELPVRLSYAQDHYGFFNGKTNTTLLPPSYSLARRALFPGATANREPDPNYSKKGMLARITYPTGGYDEIDYEGHTAPKDVAVESAPEETVPVSGFGNINPATVLSYTSTSFLVSKTQEAYLTAVGRVEGITPETEMTHHLRVTAYLVSEQSGVVETFDLTPVPAAEPGYWTDTEKRVVNLVQGHSYHLKVEVSGGENVSGQAQITYTPGTVTYEKRNVPIGGVRVARVRTYDPQSGKTMIKKYDYSAWAATSLSSAIPMTEPVYDNRIFRQAPCMTSANGNGPGMNFDCEYATGYYNSLHSDSQGTLYILSGSHIYYKRVVESLGENFDGGGTEFHFKAVSDASANPLMGNEIIGAPLSTRSWINGKESYKRIFKKEGTTTKTVQETMTHYFVDPRVSQEFKAYMATTNTGILPNCGSTELLTENHFSRFNLTSWDHQQNWIYPDTVKVRTYNPDGIHYIEEVTVTRYDNVLHAQPTRVITSSSRGEEKVLQIFYPQDIVLVGTAETARQELLSRHMLSLPLEQQAIENGALTLRVKTDYAVFPSGQVLPASQHVQSGSSPLEKRVELSAYNVYGKLQEQAKVDDFKTSYLYGYGNSLPVAEIKNGAANEVYYESFEEKVPPLTVHPVVPRAGIGHSGGEVFTVSFPRPDNKRYHISWSVWEGARWVYKKEEYAGTKSFPTGTVVDEIRIYPEGAMMSTYTYDPMIGVTSVTDPNGNPTYYTYDGLGRPVTVKDQDGNVLKTYEYQYAQ